MNIIFLDIDGVLESIEWRVEKFNEVGHVVRGKDRLDPICLNNLKTIVNTTNAKIVLTSSWKLLELDMILITQIFNDYNLKIYDVTNHYPDYRGKEIRDWLSNHKNVDNFIIIDDEIFKDYNGLEKHIIKTSMYFR